MVLMLQAELLAKVAVRHVVSAASAVSAQSVVKPIPLIVVLSLQPQVQQVLQQQDW